MTREVTGCCKPSREDAEMSIGLVGANNGSYIAETTYKYVGAGNGDYEVAATTKTTTGATNRGLLICVVFGTILALLAFPFFIWWLLSSPTSTTTKVYACNTNDVVLWSTNHKKYCCDAQGVACSTSEPFDCHTGLANSAVGWSDSKQDWCCTNKKLGCDRGKAAQAFDCDAGLNNWEHGWSSTKKSWCCANKNKGCTPKCLTESCDATCYHDVDGKGHGHVTCRDRVNWAKENVEKDSLVAALDLVNKECSCQCACSENDFSRSAPELGTCLIWGATHFKTFDNADASRYGEGQVWLIRSETVKVQGRFLATEFSKGQGAMHDIAFSGSFIGGHTLKVAALDGKIMWDDKEILKDINGHAFDPDGYGKIIYDDQGQLVDSQMENLPQRIVHINFPGSFFAQVFRWDNHLNVRIRMPAIDQDGHCGNFNGDASDDARSSVVERIGSEVGERALLFNTYTPSTPGKKLTLDDCSAAKLLAAKQECQSIQDGLAVDISNKGNSQVTQAIIKGCVHDVCFAGKQYAEEDEIEGW